MNFEKLLFTKLNRRRFLLTTGIATSLVIANNPVVSALALPKFKSYPFTLGVASGEPLPDSIVLWTRLAPEPLNGGGMPRENIKVQWQVSMDEKMSKVVQRGTTLPENPWVKYFNGRQRGYVVCDLNQQRWRSDFRLLPQSIPDKPTVPDVNAPIATAVSFEIPHNGTVSRL